MADDNNNSKVISKSNAGFPDWLNFDNLRSSSIDYLGDLTGKIWTDYNVHDPGITILEVLCYALLDLGYRTNLPQEELFRKDPADPSPENNFFTPAQILTCNPLTITDYRKLLVDIPGVKNAWLDVAEDITIDSICKSNNAGDVTPLSFVRNCTQFLNGLYHVYIELEDGVEEDKDQMVDTVRKTLLEHRNLCEDFFDITILCKQKMGVCADIDLESSSGAEAVFKQIVQNLRNFFSPSPRFYTLQQMLDKGKSIEEIFAGRPFGLQQSHGFLDIGEFEEIILRKEIHISDIYQLIFEVPGVKAVRNISIQNCQQPPCTDNNNWKFKIFENHVPDFSLDCSGFRFSYNGITITVDVKKFSDFFKLNFSNNGQALYQMPSPYLDSSIPYGNFRSDLGDYYSIQNEFPRVYGISAGSLPSDAPNQRKAWASQLQGYLLFFDQLLANYLSQLKNIRSLFSFSGPASKQQRHTYFINQITTIPAFSQLLRFDPSQNGNSLLGSSGSILMVPVDKTNLQSLIDSGAIKNFKLEEDTVIYSFPSTNKRDIGLQETLEDIRFGNYPPVVLSNNNDCWFFCLFTSSTEFALLSKRYYKSEQDARMAITSILYIASSERSYRSYINAEGAGFSFDIEMNVMSYFDYLQLLMEDEQQYDTRRELFLNHLLARFAEQFTDYSLLSYGFYSDEGLAFRDIRMKEKFLTTYPELSSNRGRGYDYLTNGWNNYNISGFEKKFKAISGIDDWKRKNLCHFEVLKYDEEVVIDIYDQGFGHILSSSKSYESRDLGNIAFHSLAALLSEKKNYQSKYSELESAYRVEINDGKTDMLYPKVFKTQQEAEQAKNELYSMFSHLPPSEDIYPSLYALAPMLSHADGKPFRQKKDPIESTSKSISDTDILLAGVNDKDQWNFLDANNAEKQIHLNKDTSSPNRFMDLNGFRRNFYPSDLKKDEVTYRYSVHDINKTFLFHSENEFDNEVQSTADCDGLLFVMADINKYQAVPVNEPIQYKIRIVSDGKILATDSAEYNSRAEAVEAFGKIAQYVQKQLYLLNVPATGKLWKYRFQLAFPQKQPVLFASVNDQFGSYDEAYAEVKQLTSASEGYNITENKNKELEIKSTRKTKNVLAIASPAAAGVTQPDPVGEANELFDLKKMVNRALLHPTKKELASFVRPVNANENEIWGYRLVKKDGFHGWYIPAVDPTADDNTKKQVISGIFQQYQNANTYLEICYGGDNIVSVKDATTQVTWYHYQLKCRNKFDGTGQELVLFESVLGYSTPDDAGAAFTASYLNILTNARNVLSYGAYISFDEVYVHGNSSSTNPFVFIPAATMEFYGFNHDFARTNLVNLANSYPVRPIKKSSTEYMQYFSCKDDQPPVKPPDCNSTNQEKTFYYFILTDGQNDVWISQYTFDKSQQALDAFYFFLILLRYKGNYFIDFCDCDCSGRLYIREILAESVKKFVSEEQAWGKEGVEKFICISQSENAFQPYFDSQLCRHSFYVACPDLGLNHPCKYDLPDKRDKSLASLISSAKSFKLEDLFQIEGKNVSLEEFVNFVFGALEKNSNLQRNQTICLDAVDLATYLSDDSVELPASLQKSKDKLQAFAYFFPVFKKQIPGSNSHDYKYFVEIKYPEICIDTLLDEPPCDCDHKGSTDFDCCCIAWTSDCCFTTCEEALQYYKEVAVCLTDPGNYVQVFDCDCGSYGIRFHCRCEKTINDPTGGINSGESRYPNHCCNEIIAKNPQYYTSPKMDCKAICRAIDLINCEGIHLVEHILLRPHCVDGDCQCIIDSCGYDNCKFVWEIDSPDPCKKDEKICFIPGADPYSFVATVVLPAWPARFRKLENRKLLENILYRETPAHVLLRILWLTPHDLCCFETYYKNWIRWLAQKRICANDFTICQLIDFLFYRQLSCFECEECIPCSAATNVDPCQFATGTIEDPNKYLNQLNDVFCWTEIDCSQAPEFIPCGDPAQRLHRASTSTPQLEIETAKPKSEALKNKASIEIAEKPSINLGEEESGIELDDERKIDRRFTSYRQEAEEIYHSSKRNKNAERVNGFLHEQAPKLTELRESVEAILKNEKPKSKNKSSLTHSQQASLIKLSIWYYLDTRILYGKQIENTTKFEALLKEISGKHFLPVFKNWKEKDIQILRPDADIKSIKKLFK